MQVTESPQTNPTEVLARPSENYLYAARTGLYILVVLAAALGAGAYSLQLLTAYLVAQLLAIASDRYLAIAMRRITVTTTTVLSGLTSNQRYNAAARNAQVIFLGNSRMQFAFSS